ncbi:PREDICTED: KHDC3-like protein [Myotis davidii]|uniref:ES cell-associated transcript 1 protein n=1 Tax=Myotis davidii TaxID=225400 RepID=L5LE27_MYODS|nr:PREDICTED: KHDC3-like protein [Myotis davidii]ELK23893.1 ES cell-associated transcript 1 protein [Myotis davidii]
MATTKRFPTLVQLEQRGGAPFQVLGDSAKQPYWFHVEYLKSPKTVHLEAWLVEAIFGPGGEHIPHVECVSQTLLRINQWDPEGEAEILIFGRPSYQKDVSKMIMNLAHYHRQLRAQGSLKNAAQQAELSSFSAAVRMAMLQASPDKVRVVKTQRSPDKVREAATQRSPDAAQEKATQRSPDAVQEKATQRSPDAVQEKATQRSPDAVQEKGTQRSPDAVQEKGTQRSPDAVQEKATQRSPDAVWEVATQLFPNTV